MQDLRENVLIACSIHEAQGLYRGTISKLYRPVYVQPDMEKQSGLQRWLAEVDDGIIPCPFGRPGGRLRIQEPWLVEKRDDGYLIDYQAYPGSPYLRWVPPNLAAPYATTNQIYRKAYTMPDWASRMIRRISAVDVKRLGQITADDCRDAGFKPDSEISLLWRENLQSQFIDHWNTFPGFPLWNAEFWVWEITL